MLEARVLQETPSFPQTPNLYPEIKIRLKEEDWKRSGTGI